MAPSVDLPLTPDSATYPSKQLGLLGSKAQSAVIHRSLKAAPLQVAKTEGNVVTFSNGQSIRDTTCGAAVACIGFPNERVKAAMVAQMDKFSCENRLHVAQLLDSKYADTGI